MKTWKKVLRAILALIIIGWIVCATMFTINEKRIKEYSGYCMDEVRAQLWEYVWNVSNTYEGKNDDWYYLYNWNVSYEWVDYTYYCRVLGKEKVDLKLDKMDGEVCEWESCDISDESQEINEPVAIDGIEQGNSLILVFSPTWNTKRIATFISEINGSTLTEIIPAEEYTDEDRNWRNEESRTFKEFKDPSIRPEIENEISLNGYDTIYLWFPIWFGITPNIILTLLENYDFAGKNIILFCTSEHIGIEKAVEYLEPYNLNVIGSRRFAQDATKEEVQEWLESL